jgi:hypothetical protein
MNDYDLLVRLQSLEKSQAMLISTLKRVLNGMKPEKQLLDNADMMRLFKMSARTLAYMRSRHELDYIRIKGKIYYEKEAVDRFIKSKQVARSLMETESIVMSNLKNAENELQ